MVGVEVHEDLNKMLHSLSVAGDMNGHNDLTQCYLICVLVCGGNGSA